MLLSAHSYNSCEKMGVCALCGKDAELRDSHIIPKFVGKWMKDTSATGFLSKSEDLSKRVQDLLVVTMLCGDCEQRLSRLESYFASKVFYPFHQSGMRSFDYDERLRLFALSLSWRTMQTCYGAFKEEEPDLISVLEKVDRDWKDILLDKRSEVSPYETHLFFFDYLEDGGGLPLGLQWYTLRATDIGLVEGIGRLLVYTKLPWMMFVTSLVPPHIEGWNQTLLLKTGKISTHQEVADPEFGAYLLGRAKQAVGGRLPKWREAAFVRAVEKDPDRFLESASFQVHMAERDRALRARMEKMPKFVGGLFTDVIAKAMDEPGKSKAESQLTRLAARAIADALANLTEEETARLDSGVRNAIQTAREGGSAVKATTQCEGIWVTFMVHPHSTKEFQREKIIEETERLKSLRPSAEKVLLAVFSMNVDEEGASFEMGFWLE